MEKYNSTMFSNIRKLIHVILGMEGPPFLSRSKKRPATYVVRRRRRPGEPAGDVRVHLRPRQLRLGLRLGRGQRTEIVEPPYDTTNAHDGCEMEYPLASFAHKPITNWPRR